MNSKKEDRPHDVNRSEWWELTLFSRWLVSLLVSGPSSVLVPESCFRFRLENAAPCPRLGVGRFIIFYYIKLIARTTRPELVCGKEEEEEEALHCTGSVLAQPSFPINANHVAAACCWWLAFCGWWWWPATVCRSIAVTGLVVSLRNLFLVNSSE